MALTWRFSDSGGTGVGNETSYTYSSVSIGTAASDRWVYVAVIPGTFTATGISSVTVGGVTATADPNNPASISGYSAEVFFFAANVPTGTTANVVVNFSGGGCYDNNVAVWTDNGEPTWNDAASDTTFSTNTLSVAIDVPSSGKVLAFARRPGMSSATWSGATEDFDVNADDTTGASEEGLSSQSGRTVSVTFSGGFGFESVLGATAFSTGGGGPATITGTGAITTGATTVSGTAERSVTGTGAVTVAAATVSGAAERVVTGTGAVITGATTVAGSGAVGAVVTGTGAITTGGVTVAGTGERAVTGTGAIATPAATVAGTAERQITGAGAVTLPAAQVAGPAERAVTGTGAISAPAATVDGSGTVSEAGTVLGTGAIETGGATVSGVATRVITGSGAITLGAVQLETVANRSYSATGTITLAAVQVSGRQEGQQAPAIQGGWGIREEDADEGRERTEHERRTTVSRRRAAVERAFAQVSPQVEPTAEPGPVPADVAREVAPIAAQALRMRAEDVANVEVAIARLEAEIAAVWVDMQAEAARRAREEEAAILLLLVA